MLALTLRQKFKVFGKDDLEKMRHEFEAKGGSAPAGDAAAAGDAAKAEL